MPDNWEEKLTLLCDQGYLSASLVDVSFRERLEELAIPYKDDSDGIRLGDIELLDDGLISSSMNVFAREQVNRLTIFKAIGSTNTFLMDRFREENCHGHICLAEAQTAGRGRRGREWVSPFGCNLYMSIAWQFLKTRGALEGLSLMIGLKVAEVFKQIGLHDIGLKWPNDLMLGDKKLGGILVEVLTRPHNKFGVVIGIGLNLRLPDALEGKIDQPHIDLTGLGVDWTRNGLAAALLDSLLPSLSRFQIDGFARYRQEWSQLDVFSQKRVNVLVGDDRIEGVSMGVDSTGNLLLKTQNGLQSFGAGEVSLRGID